MAHTTRIRRGARVPIRTALILLLLLLGVTLGQGDLLAKPNPAARQLYNRVMEEFRNRDYEAALAGFRLFLEIYDRSRLAASAQFWKGECEYRLARYEDALTSFEKVLIDHSGSSKRRGATLKIGLIYAKVGQREEAGILLNRLLVDYPDSPEAEAAEKAIQRYNLHVEMSPPIPIEETVSLKVEDEPASE